MNNTTTSSGTGSNFNIPQFMGQPIEEGARVALLVLGWLACISGVFGNILIIVTLLSQPALRSIHNIFIANLAVADLIIVGYIKPFWLLDLALGYHPVANFTQCSANAVLIALSFIVSVYTLVLISLDRYMSICHNPTFVKYFTKRTILGSCAGAWLISCVESVMPLFGVGNTRIIYNPWGRMCAVDQSDPTNFYSLLSIVNLSLPSLLIGFFSFSIFRFYRQSKRRIGQWNRNQNQNQDGQNQGQTRQRPKTRISPSDIALIRSLVLVFALLVILYMPLAIVIAVQQPITIEASQFISLLFFLNHSINWIVYGVMNKNFKNGYKRLLYRCLGLKTQDSGTEATTMHTLATIHPRDG